MYSKYENFVSIPIRFTYEITQFCSGLFKT